MKNKQNERKAKATVLALLMLMVIVLPFVSCGGDEEEQPEPVAYTSSGIPIYAGAGVTVEEAKGKKNDIDTACGVMDPTGQTALKTKTQKIVIVDGTEASADKATGIVNVGKNASSDTIALAFIAMLAQVIDNSKETVRMAKAFVASAVNAKSI
jgi:hypothetical protein